MNPIIVIKLDVSGNSKLCRDEDESQPAKEAFRSRRQTEHLKGLEIRQIPG